MSKRRDVLVLLMRSMMTESGEVLRPNDVTHCPHDELAAIVPVPYPDGGGAFTLVFCCEGCAALAMKNGA